MQCAVAGNERAELGPFNAMREWQGQVNLRLKTAAATAKSIQPTANTQSEIGAIGQEGVRGEMGRSERRWAK